MIINKNKYICILILITSISHCIAGEKLINKIIINKNSKNKEDNSINNKDKTVINKENECNSMCNKNKMVINKNKESNIKNSIIKLMFNKKEGNNVINNKERVMISKNKVVVNKSSRNNSVGNRNEIVSSKNDEKDNIDSKSKIDNYIFELLPHRSNEAKRYLKRNIKDPYCCYLLGTVYLSEQDLKNADKYLSKAAEMGSLEAINSIGDGYYSGDIRKKNHKEALKYYVNAAKEGNGTAQFNAGAVYFKYAKSIRSLKKSIYWFNKALENNDIKELKAHILMCKKAAQQKLKELMKNSKKNKKNKKISKNKKSNMSKNNNNMK